MKPLFNPDITDEMIDQWIDDYLTVTATNGMAAGARNCDVSRALGLTKVTDAKQWISYRALQRLIEAGTIRKVGAIYYHI